MGKHILGKGIYMVSWLFICMVLGERFILEPDVRWRYDRPESRYVYPGRAFTSTGQP